MEKNTINNIFQEPSWFGIFLNTAKILVIDNFFTYDCKKDKTREIWYLLRKPECSQEW